MHSATEAIRTLARRSLPVLVVLSVVLTAVYWYVAPVVVSEHQVELGEFVAEVMGTGTLEARVGSTISPKISGRVHEILVDQGDQVQAGQLLFTLDKVGAEISRRLSSLFVPDATGRRPSHGNDPRFADDPHWRDLVLFHEYFHGDNGCGIGASHQTGWTALVTRLPGMPADNSRAARALVGDHAVCAWQTPSGRKRRQELV